MGEAKETGKEEGKGKGKGKGKSRRRGGGALADDHQRLREIHEFAMRMGSKLKYDAQKRKMDAEAIRRHAGQTGWPAAARALRAQPDR